MNDQLKNSELLASRVVGVFLGMFPTMEMMSGEAAKLYSHEMAAAIASNDDLTHTELKVGIDYLRSGQYKSKYAPSVPEFMGFCKAKLNNIRYLNRLPSPEKTAAEKEKSALVGKTSMEMIRGMLKDD